MFEAKNMIGLFPSPVWISKLPAADSAVLNAAIIPRIDALAAADPAFEAGGSWQSPNDLQADPAFAPLNGYAEAAAAEALAAMNTVERTVVVTGCWANVKAAGARGHQQHTHPNNYLSGVYYAKVQPGGDQILFYDPRYQNKVILPKVASRNALNSRSATLTVEVGTLVLFPAWLTHAVPTNQSAERRISVSFNLMFTDFTETHSRPRWKGGGQSDE